MEEFCFPVGPRKKDLEKYGSLASVRLYKASLKVFFLKKGSLAIFSKIRTRLKYANLKFVKKRGGFEIIKTKKDCAERKAFFLCVLVNFVGLLFHRHGGIISMMMCPVKVSVT